MDHVEYGTDGPVALIRLDRPPVNALSEEVAKDLGEAFAMAAADDIRAVVITGHPHFAAGADIKRFQDAHMSGSQTKDEGQASTLGTSIESFEGLEKPTIAAIHGYALGGGLELSMGADFRYLADDAQVGQPEIKLGVIPGAGGTQRLSRIVGYQKAKEMVYSGRFLTAPEALKMGLADKVLAADELLETAMTDAAQWAAGPTRAYAAAKRAMREGWGEPLEDALARERRGFNKAFWTEDAREGVAAFVEKREAVFGGS